MFLHAILGLLRNGDPRHGYDLISEYRARSGLKVNAGNFYRDLAKLVGQGLISSVENPPDQDPRRIPYAITAGGRSEFDLWLIEAGSADEDLNVWVLFAEMLAPSDRRQALDRLQEGLWLMNKSLIHARDDTLAVARRRGNGGYQPSALLLLRRIKQITAELEFLDELRRGLETVPGPALTVAPDSRPATGDRKHARP